MRIKVSKLAIFIKAALQVSPPKIAKKKTLTKKVEAMNMNHARRSLGVLIEY